VGFFRRSSKQQAGADAVPPPPLVPPRPVAPDSATIRGLYHPDFIPPEPVDYGGHRDEVDAFIESVGAMDRAEVARVARQGVASGATMSRRWAEVEAHLAYAAAQNGLEIGRIAARHRADAASRSSVGRMGNGSVMTDFCAGVWAEVIVLRDHLETRIVDVAFEPWQGVLAPADWMVGEDGARLD
jgi:hypothetical protein